MKIRSLILLTLLPAAINAYAQKPFTEGTITYRVKVEAAGKKVSEGTYTFIIKGGQVRKELQMSNGYNYALLMNCNSNTIYSLQNHNGKKYAIQLNMDEMRDRQQKYTGATLKGEKNTGKIIAGITAFKGDLAYTDGSHLEIYFTPEWYPDKQLTYERFPGATFLPLAFTYIEDDSHTMYMEAETVSVAPVENAVFRVPNEYKIITNAEYKQLSR